MPKYRKKPVIIEARQLDVDNEKELQEWCGGHTAYAARPDEINIGLIIPTSEGNMVATFGDWIIKGVKGEFYPCKPDIFKMTYEYFDE